MIIGFVLLQQVSMHVDNNVLLRVLNTNVCFVSIRGIALRVSGGGKASAPPLESCLPPLELLNSLIPKYITTHCPPIVVVQNCICPPPYEKS